MTNYDPTNNGALFKNERRQNDKQPTHTGNVCAKCIHCGNNTDYWMSAWVKTSKSGNKFFSIAINPKDDQSAPPAGGGYQSGADNDFDDDIPF